MVTLFGDHSCVVKHDDVKAGGCLQELRGLNVSLFALLQELDQREDKIEQLEREKTQIIKELFACRGKVGSSAYEYDDTTFIWDQNVKDSGRILRNTIDLWSKETDSTETFGVCIFDVHQSHLNVNHISDSMPPVLAGNRLSMGCNVEMH